MSFTRSTLLLAAVAASAIAVQPASAAQIILNESAVIGGTPGLNATYAPGNIFDRQTGPITEAFMNGEYYLNPDSGGITNAFITIDLGAAYLLGRFDLFNTTNGFNDRGTAQFQIRAANSTTAATGPASGLALGADVVTLVEGALARPTGMLREAQSFAVFNEGVAYRYLEFRPLTASAPSYTSYAYGLNELRVFDGPASFAGSVPEPGTWGLMLLGFGLVGAASRRRRPATAIA